MNLLRNLKPLALLVPITVWAFMLILISPYSRINYQTENNNKVSSDLLNYVTGAIIFKHRDIHNLYNYETQKAVQSELLGTNLLVTIMGFRTPPMVAAFYSLLLSLGFSGVFWAMAALNTVLVWLSIVLLSNKSFRTTLILLTLSPITVYVYMTLQGGQVDGFLLLFLTAIYLLLKKNRFGVAGVLCGLLFIKPQFLLFVPAIALLLKDTKQVGKFLISAILSICGFVLVNQILYGQSFLTDYAKFLFSSENLNSGTDFSNNFNVTGVLYALTKGMVDVKVFYVLSMGLFVGFCYALWKLKKSRSYDILFACTMLCIPLINIHTMPTDLIVFLIPLAIISPILFKKKNMSTLLVTVFVFVFIPWMALLNMEWVSVVMFGGFLGWMVWDKKIRIF